MGVVENILGKKKKWVDDPDPDPNLADDDYIERMERGIAETERQRERDYEDQSGGY